MYESTVHLRPTHPLEVSLLHPKSKGVFRLRDKEMHGTQWVILLYWVPSDRFLLRFCDTYSDAELSSHPVKGGFGRAKLLIAKVKRKRAAPLSSAQRLNFRGRRPYIPAYLLVMSHQVFVDKRLSMLRIHRSRQALPVCISVSLFLYL